MVVKRTSAEMEQKCQLELEGQFGTSTTRYTPTTQLPKLVRQTFNGNILKWQEFWVSFEASIHRNPNLRPVDEFNYLKAELEGDAGAVISELELLMDQNSLNVQYMYDLLLWTR